MQSKTYHLSLSLSLSLSLPPSLSLPHSFCLAHLAQKVKRKRERRRKKGGEIPFRNGKWCYCRCRGGKQEKRVTGTAVVSRRPWPISNPPYIAVVWYLHLRFWYISRAEKENGFFSSIHLTPIEVTALEFIEISLSAEHSRKWER